MSVDGGEPDIWDFFETLGNPPVNWSWDAVSLRCGGTFEEHLCDPLRLELSPGAHEIVFSDREFDARLDVVVITTEVDRQPTFGP